MKTRSLTCVNRNTRHIVLERKCGKTADPEEVLKQPLAAVTQDELFHLRGRQDLRLGKAPLGFPEPRDRRVFIGTNYDSHAHVIPEIKAAVFSKGYTPVVVAEVNVPLDQTHDVSLLLLHTCAYAVFDVTSPAGQLMEIERAKDYGVKVLLVRSRPIGHQPVVSRMIKVLGYRLRTYRNMEDVKMAVLKFLPAHVSR